MFVKSIHKPNVSSSINSLYWPACVVVLLILGTFAGSSVADPGAEGTWTGTWECPASGESGLAINWVLGPGDSAEGSWEDPTIGYVITLSATGTYTYDSGNGRLEINVEGDITEGGEYYYYWLTVIGYITGDHAEGNLPNSGSWTTYRYGDYGEYEYVYAEGNWEADRVVSPSFTVTSPNGSENWEQGTSHTITWTSSGNVGSNVKIELYKGTQLNLTVASSTANDGSHNWNIPAGQTPGSDYRIKVTSTSNSNYYDVSDGYFSITAAIPTSDSYESDDLSSQANWIYSGTPQTHSIYPADDIDWVKFSLSTESQVVIETSGPAGDTRIFLGDSNGIIEEDNDSGDDYFSRIDRLFYESDSLQAGTYYVAIVENGLDEEIARYDITLTIVIGDFCGADFGSADGYVDVWDLMQFADHWHTSTGDSNWDVKFDLTDPDFANPDGYVDVWDLMVFADNWHKGVNP